MSDDREREARRRRRLAAAGDTSTERADDDRDEGWSESDTEQRDAELRREVPPHHE